MSPEDSVSTHSEESGNMRNGKVNFGVHLRGQDNNQLNELFVNLKYQGAEMDELRSKLSKHQPFFSQATLRVEGSDFAINISDPLFDKERQLFNLHPPTKSHPLSKFSIGWEELFHGTILRPISMGIGHLSKIVAAIEYREPTTFILDLMNLGILTFNFILCYGSSEMNYELMKHFNESRKFRAHSRELPSFCSMLATISPRLIQTGALMNFEDRILLKEGDRIILTADRTYSRRCSRNIVYCNMKLQLSPQLLNSNLRICIGQDNIQLQIRKHCRQFLQCEVTKAGVLQSHQDVIFPKKFQYDQITIEEIEDLLFTAETNINVIVLPAPGDPDYYDSIKNAIKEFNLRNRRIFAKVSQRLLVTEQYAKWIADTYDGVIVDYDRNPGYHELLSFNANAKYLIDRCYQQKKPVILKGIFPKEILPTKGHIITPHAEDQKYFFFYPDKYLLESYEINNANLNTVSLLHEDRLIRLHDYVIEESKHFVDKSTTGSDSIARSIVLSSFDLNATAIILTSISGRMAEKIAHFRPRCTIILLTKNAQMVRYIKIVHQVYVAVYYEKKKLTYEEKKHAIRKRILFGLLYGTMSGLIKHHDYVLYGHRPLPDGAGYGFPFKFAAFKCDVSLLENSLKECNL